MSTLSRLSSLSALLFLPVLAFAQAGPSPFRPPPGVAAGPSLVPPDPPAPPREGAQFDMTGYWVAVVTEDYQWRMITPPRGDFSNLPLTGAAVEVANRWDPDADRAAGVACRPFGAPGIMRLPVRLHVSWEDDTTLRMDIDAGSQTRLFRFDASAAPGERSWQGHSVATWQKVAQARDVFTAGQGHGRVGRGPGGSLKVVTTHLASGYLRKNEIPYGERTVMTEYFNRIEEPNGDSWLILTTIIEDPDYLSLPVVHSTHYLREPDGAKWNPTPCRTDPPLRETAPVLRED